jgi:hypothetical protein
MTMHLFKTILGAVSQELLVRDEEVQVPHGVEKADQAQTIQSVKPGGKVGSASAPPCTQFSFL